MKVKLIQATQNPIEVMWTAARTCYSAKSPIDMWENGVIRNKAINQPLPDGINSKEYIEFKESANKNEEEIAEKHWNLVKKVLDSGHQSIAEHVYFTFAIEGISRACSHQLVRHRAGIVFSQQSQRYVEIKEDIKELENLKNSQGYGRRRFIQQYFAGCGDWCTSSYVDSMYDSLIEYRRLVDADMKPEDARQVLPNATKTNITMSLNYRELIHICNLRLCTKAQKEIRDLFNLIVKEIKLVDERLASYLVPQCEVYGICFEANCCRRKPNIDEILQDQKTVE